MKNINIVFIMKQSMTSKIMLGAIFAIAFLAGTITTATLVEATPNTDGDGDGEMEGIIHEITDLLNHVTFGLEAIQNAITSVQSDITMIKSDVGDIKTETDKIPMIKSDVTDIKTETDKITSINADIGDIKTETDKIPMIKSDVGDIKTETDKIQMLKDDIADIKSQLANPPEHLTKFEHFNIFASAFDSDLDEITVAFHSSGPMIIEVCKRSGDSGEGTVQIDFPFEQNIQFFMDEDDVPECRTVGVAAGDHIQIKLVADPGFLDSAAVGVDITIRTTPSSVIVKTVL